MKNSIRFFALLFAAVFCFGILAGCADSAPGGGSSAPGGDTSSPGGDLSGSFQFTYRDILAENIRVAFIPLGLGASAGAASVDGLEFAVKDWDNIKVDVFDPNYDVNIQITLLNDVANQGYDAIILVPLDTAALNPTVTEIESMGIPIITMGNTVTALHTANVLCDEYAMGWLVGEETEKKIGKDGNIIMLDCDIGNAGTVIFSKGFEEYAKQNTNWEIVGQTNVAAWSTENAATAMRDYLTMYDDIDAVWTVFDDIAVGAMQAIEAAGRENEGIVIYGQEGSRAAFDYIASGRITGTLFSDIYTYYGTGMKMALHAIMMGYTATTAGFPQTPKVYVNMEIVDSTNVEQFSYIRRWS